MRVKFALVGLLAVASAALSGCTNDPQQAISMSGFTLSEAQVERDAKIIEADVQAARRNSSQPGQPVEDTPIRGDARQAVVQYAAFNEIARRYAQEQRVSVPAPDRAGAASQTGLPESDPFVGLVAQTQAYANALSAQASPAAPTEADMAELRKAYDQLAAQSGQAGSMTDADLAALFNGQEIRRALGLRNALLATAERNGLVVNPRYTPVGLSLGTAQTDLGPVGVATLPLGEQGTGAVRDVS